MPGIVWGSVVAVVVQMAIFWALFVWALPEQQGLAHGLGVLVRFFAVAGMAFIGVGGLGLPAAPTLFSMVGCLFGSTLLEVVFLQRRNAGRVGGGAVTIGTQL